MVESSEVLPATAARSSGAGLRETALIGLFCLPLALLIALLVWRSTLVLSLNYNEGWNAYWAQAVASGNPLYVPAGALRTNNYPPISFVMIGTLARWGADAIFAGRLIAWAAFVVTGGWIAANIRNFGDDRLAAVFGGLMFFAFMATQYANYVGVDDPQMLAHAVMGAGLFLVLRPGATLRDMMVAGAVMAFALFIKHNIIALPLASAIWLSLWDRRRGAAFAGTLVACGIAGLAVCWAVYGADFFTSLTAPRVYSLEWAHRRVVLWLMPMLVPLIVPAVLTMRPLRDRIAMFLAIYAVIALVVGVIEATGEGVSYSCMFDVVIAFCLAGGRLLGRLGRREATRELRAYAIAIAGLSLVFWSTTQATHQALRVLPWIKAERAKSAATRDVVQEIAARTGPALCETPALCYWAGKRYALDVFNFDEALRRGRQSEEVLAAQIAAGRFAVVQTNPGASYSYGRLPPRSEAMLRQNYELIAAVGRIGDLYEPP